jgi:manganese/zinc/iron transport system substrate-binding protein
MPSHAHGASRRDVLALLLAAPLALAARPSFASGALKVVATTSMLADMMANVGGDRVEVRALMGPGVDPHSYRQTRTDIAAMLSSDLAIWHGLYLEAQMEEFMLSLGERRPAPALAESLPKAELRQHATYKGRYDPHVWMAPELWSRVVPAAVEALIGVDPDGAAVFEANARTYRADIAELAAYAEARLATIPDGSRVLVTAHDAFGYFGDAYGLEVEGVQGISTASEAGLRRIEELVDLIVARNVQAVFVESSVSERNLRALVEGAAARGHEVRIGGELYSDAMGRGGTYEGTYIGMIDHNVTAIVRALGGDAPERGMRGTLSEAV